MNTLQTVSEANFRFTNLHYFNLSVYMFSMPKSLSTNLRICKKKKCRYYTQYPVKSIIYNYSAPPPSLGRIFLEYKLKIRI